MTNLSIYVGLKLLNCIDIVVRVQNQLSALSLHGPLDLHVDTVSFKENLKNAGSGTPDPIVIIGDEIGLESL